MQGFHPGNKAWKDRYRTLCPLSCKRLATVSTVMPTSVLTRLARAQAETVDFATSNVRGAGIPLFIGGGRIVANHPVGPLGGVAFNLTLLSNDGNLDMGLHVDTAAVAQPELLRDCISESLAKIARHAPQPVPTIDNAPDTTITNEVKVGKPTEIKKRWWQRLRASKPQ